MGKDRSFKFAHSSIFYGDMGKDGSLKFAHNSIFCGGMGKKYCKNIRYSS